MSADVENEYFSDGMTEELISKLSRLHDLTVIARTSVMQYKATGKGIAEIGRELQVGTILEGSVRKAGARLRITAQLIDVASQAHLWSEDYDRTWTTCSRSRAMLPSMSSSAADHPQARGSEADREGWNERPGGIQRLSQGPLPLQHVVEAGFGKKHRILRAGDSRDPNFAKAYAAMAFSYESRVSLAICHRTKPFQR